MLLDRVVEIRIQMIMEKMEEILEVVVMILLYRHHHGRLVVVIILHVAVDRLQIECDLMMIGEN